MPRDKSINKVLVIGSGPIVIGQAAEFDYAGTQACRVLKDMGVNVVLVNSNPATIMTDQALAAGRPARHAGRADGADHRFGAGAGRLLKGARRAPAGHRRGGHR